MLFQNNSIKNKINNSRGFTLIEVITAISLVAVGVIGSFVLVQKLVSFTSTSSYQLPAVYLAQEGLEIVRNIRDTNWLDPANPDWDDGIVCCVAPLPSCECEGDYTSTGLDQWADRFLNIYDSGEGDFYHYSFGAGAVSPFKRKIVVTPRDENGDSVSDILEVEVIVTWQERTRNHEIIMRENLYRYYQ